MTEEHTSDPITVCYRHPDRETGLRCNRCGKPICTKCARRVATGYRCPDCIKMQQKSFDTAKPQDFVLGFLTSGVLSFIGANLINLISGLGFFFIFFIVAIGTGAGALIADIVRRVIGKRRSRPLFITVTAGVVVGAVLANLWIFIYMFYMLFGGFSGSGILSLLYSLLWPGIYTFLAASTTYVRLSGIQLNR